MAGYDKYFLRVLIRQAKLAKPDPDTDGQKAFLGDIISGHFTTAKNGELTLTSSTINGKSVTFEPPQGMTKTDVMIAAEKALEFLEAGLNPTSEAYARHC